MSDSLPFFSVCIPAVNRGRTIYNTLKSVVLQTFRDFELIIVNCSSIDNTDDEIKRFFKSDIFIKNSCKYKYVKQDIVPSGIEDWNAPIEFAIGKYIAMLEGDDQHDPEYLNYAHKILSQNSSIGLFAASNQFGTRRVLGTVQNKKVAFDSYRGYHIPPPSEAIFMRVDGSGNPYKYNIVDFEYAGEIDLYIRLGLSGYNAYFSDKKLIIRDNSIKDRSINTWHFYNDGFKCLKMYKNSFSKFCYFYAVVYHTADVLIDLYRIGKFKKIFKETRHILRYVNIFVYVIAFFRSSALFLYNKIKKVIKR